MKEIFLVHQIKRLREKKQTLVYFCVLLSIIFSFFLVADEKVNNVSMFIHNTVQEALLIYHPLFSWSAQQLIGMIFIRIGNANAATKYSTYLCACACFMTAHEKTMKLQAIRNQFIIDRRYIKCNQLKSNVNQSHTIRIVGFNQLFSWLLFIVKWKNRKNASTYEIFENMGKWSRI